ncbi:MAG: hypothetical protein AB7T49_02965 [Oligoflexales bacterium]
MTYSDQQIEQALKSVMTMIESRTSKDSLDVTDKKAFDAYLLQHLERLSDASQLELNREPGTSSRMLKKIFVKLWGVLTPFIQLVTRNQTQYNKINCYFLARLIVLERRIKKLEQAAHEN